MNVPPSPWKRAYYTLLLLSFLWTAGACASPLLLAGGSHVEGLIARLLYSPVCHQQTGRSFFLHGYPLAVCMRCGAVYAGFLLGVALYPAFARKKQVDFRFARFLLFLLPVVLDYLLDVAGVWENSPASRSVSGVIAGLGLSAFVTPAWIEAWRQVFHGKQSEPATGYPDE